MQHRPVVKLAPCPREQAPQSKSEHGEADADHDAERPEHDTDRRFLVVGDRVEPCQRRVQIVLQDERGSLGDLDCVIDALLRAVRNAEQDKRRAVGMAVEVSFHRHDLLRLVLQRIEAMEVARENLDRRDDGGHPHRHGKHLARMGIRPVAQQVPCAYAADHESGGKIGGDHRMHQAIGEAGIEDDFQPALARQILAVGADLVADRGLHPAVDRQDPESRDERPHRDHECGGEMELPADLVHAEQHHAEETRLEEESRQHFIGHKRPDDRPGDVGKDRPVGAELIAHHDARDDAHGEGDGENLEPVFEQVEIELLAGLEPQTFEHREIARQPDREGREDEMEAHREGELYPGEKQGVELFEHIHSCLATGLAEPA